MVVVVVKMALKSDNMWKRWLAMDEPSMPKHDETDALMASMIEPIQPSSVFLLAERPPQYIKSSGKNG